MDTVTPVWFALGAVAPTVTDGVLVLDSALPASTLMVHATVLDAKHLSTLKRVILIVNATLQRP